MFVESHTRVVQRQYKKCLAFVIIESEKCESKTIMNS